MAHTADVGERPPGDRLIWLVSAGLATAGALLWWRGLALPESDPHLWWPAVALVFALSERFAVHLPFGRDTHSLTFSMAPMVLGLFFLDADELVLAAVVGMLLTQAVIYRNPPIKLAFNTASIFLQATVAVAVFAAVIEATRGHRERARAGRPGWPHSRRPWPPTCSATSRCSSSSRSARASGTPPSSGGPWRSPRSAPSSSPTSPC